MNNAVLQQLQSTLEQEIPMCAQMGIKVHAYQPNEGLTLQAPLDQNFNHQRTGFAGSLNALCTVAGWGSVYLLLKERNQPGSVVIRRSSIRYLKPVDSPEITAVCAKPSEEDVTYFIEMLAAKGQAKLNLDVAIYNSGAVAVTFQGCYVVIDAEHHDLQAAIVDALE